MGVPRQVPVVPSVFVNRDAVRAAIGAEFRKADELGLPAFVALHGAGGVGVKSAVWKLYWEEPDRFPDGAVVVDLGDAEHGDPAALSEALGSALVALGVPAGDLPVSVSDRQKCLLTKTSGKKLLIVLVDVPNPAQVKPFLVSAPGSAVVAVCRTPMRELFRLGFRPVPVPPLDPVFGAELFERMLGPDWCSVDGVDPAAVVRGCGGYPLAITTTAAQVAMTERWDRPELLRRLSSRGMAALDDDAQGFVRESFDRTYAGLSAGVARTYRIVLGVHPGTEFRASAAAALLGGSREQVQADLAVLVKAQMLSRVGADRYAMHDLVRWHARDCLVREEPDAAVPAAIRGIEWYLDTAVPYDKALSGRPRSGPRYAALAAHTAETPELARAKALAWLELERANLVDAVLLAERHEADDLAWQLCEALWGVLHLHGHYEDWETTHRAGLAAANRTGDRRAVMRMASQSGAVLLKTGKLADAAALFAESLAAAREVGDPSGVQSALEWLGKVAAAQGDPASALSYLDESQAVSLVDSEALPRTRAIIELQRGRFLAQARRFEDAAEELTRAADYFDTTAETDNQAKTALEIGLVRTALGLDATAWFRRAATGFAVDGSRRGEAAALRALCELGVEVAPNTRRLIEIYRELGDPRLGELEPD
ncbi:hypothetical protein [Actinokineospora sp.]|uniref:hypothetical protein n=1 Tax=Actinokineospora sp. TaxID=1872133 RepID=UPI0040383694